MAHGRAFLISLGVALLFHLSMVTLFSIVIFFPREDIHYHLFRIVRPPAGLRVVTARGERLRAPSPENAPTGEALGTGRGEVPWSVLPDIKLPEIEFAELRRLRVRQKGTDLRTRRESLFQPKPRDTWARFGDALSRLRLSGGETPEEQDTLAPFTRPAAGFEAHIEWVAEPRDRELLFAPPIVALWGADPAVLDEPLVIQFSVNARGRVVSVWSPQLDDDGILSSAQNSLLKYRFEPAEIADDQQATLHVMAAPDSR